MTPKELAEILFDVATFTKTNGNLPEQSWIEELIDIETAKVYGRLLDPSSIVSIITDALLDAGADLDFERYDIDPNDSDECWDRLSPQLNDLLDEHDLTGDERHRMRELVEAEFFIKFQPHQDDL